MRSSSSEAAANSLKLWSQLSLSSSLEIPQLDYLAASKNDFSIHISQGVSSTASQPQPRGWVLDNIAVRAPDCVLCTQLERLHVQLDFHTIQGETPHTQKRLKPCPQKKDLSESALLLDRPLRWDKTHLEHFEKVVDVQSCGPPGLIDKCVEQPKTTSGQEPNPTLSNRTVFSARKKHQNSETTVSSTSTIAARHDVKGRKIQGRYPKEITDKLKAWLETNTSCPYPTPDEKLELMKETGLQRSIVPPLPHLSHLVLNSSSSPGQLNSWFSKARSRSLRSPKVETVADEMLLEHVDEHTHLPEQFDIFDTDDMLLSIPDEKVSLNRKSEQLCHGDKSLPEYTDNVPSLTSHSSTETFLMSTTSSVSRKRPLLLSTGDTNHAILSLPSSCELVSSALCILIGGYSSRRSLANITVEKAPPKTTLSSLAPAIFCPGYKELMAHNSRFLPTILHAFSSSWVRNCQGPGLRSKLIALTNAKVSELDDVYREGSGQHGSVERLSAVVQTRLWGTMQRKLFDPAVASKLQCETSYMDRRVDAEELGEDEDLLAPSDKEKELDSKRRMSIDRGGLIGDEFMVDDELLFVNDNRDAEQEGLLDYFDDKERLAVERQTDEVLFWDGDGDYNDDGGSDIVLSFDSEVEEESMLL